MTFLSFMISTYRLLLRICWLPRWRRRCATLLVTGGGLCSCRIVLFKHIKVKEVECMESKLWTYLIFVIFFTRAKFLENKIYTVNCQFTQ